MTLRNEMLTLSKEVRPKILKLASRRKLVDMCFKEFQRAVYPGAPQDQVAMLRIAFFAGVCELHTMLIYASDTDTMDATEGDLKFWSNIVEEFETFHERVIATAWADKSDAN